MKGLGLLVKLFVLIVNIVVVVDDNDNDDDDELYGYHDVYYDPYFDLLVFLFPYRELKHVMM